MNLPRFGGHPRSHESAVGVCHGQTEAAGVHEGVQGETVRLVRESGKSVGAVARELDLTETALRSWVRQAEIDAGRGAPGALTTEEREELGAAAAREPDAADGARHPKKSDGLLREGERVRFAFIAAEKAALPGPAAVPHAAGLARRASTRGSARPPAPRAQADAPAGRSRSRRSTPRAGSATAARGSTPSCADRGCRTSRKRVARLMRDHGLGRPAPAAVPGHDRLAAPVSRRAQRLGAAVRAGARPTRRG